MKRDEFIDSEATAMIAFMGPLLGLVDIGIKHNKTPKEIADYATELFKEFEKNMNKIKED